MLSFNIFERNGTMNQAFRFAHSVAPNLNTVGGLGKALAFLALPTYCPSTKKKKKKNQPNSLILKACQKDEQPRLNLNFTTDYVNIK